MVAGYMAGAIGFLLWVAILGMTRVFTGWVLTSQGNTRIGLIWGQASLVVANIAAGGSGALVSTLAVKHSVFNVVPLAITVACVSPLLVLTLFRSVVTGADDRRREAKVVIICVMPYVTSLTVFTAVLYRYSHMK